MNKNLHYRYLEQTSLTPEFILEYERDMYLYSCEYDPDAEWDMDLTLESTVDDWRLSRDLVEWKKLGRALNEQWHMTATDQEWKKVLKPFNKRTLKDVFTFIANHGKRYTTRPARLLGSNCQKAGIFLAIKELYASRGHDVSTLRPSSNIIPWLNRTNNIIYDIHQITPNQLPMVYFKSYYTQITIKYTHCLFILAMLPLIFSLNICRLLPYWIEITCYYLALIAVYPFIWKMDQQHLKIKNEKIQFQQEQAAKETHWEDIKTFTDLVNKMSGSPYLKIN